ncbi:unnamed protein product [Brachionus calyciflorus]|uniref:Reverse transcriptase domain-containing protein n=1 Tax=Brachionus calyciflorus TaxID=104777 RepID=A0A814RTL8_9BILA|nr:unnamed protein product [Brachionus calyciflorus]
MIRAKMRYNRKMINDKNAKQLEKTYTKDINEFWRILSKNRQIDKKIDIPLDKLHSEFEKMFNERVSTEGNQEDIEIKTKVKKYVEELKNFNEQYQVNEDIIDEIIKNLPNNKQCGKSGVKNEMLKYGRSPLLTKLVAIFISKIINQKTVPSNLSIGKITPILKNSTESNKSTSNIRPITISDTLSNIFEKYILYEINKTYKNDELQFGFKSKSSCNHAVITLKEALLWYKKKKKAVFSLAIDFSKAFDKIKRYRLFEKLMNIGLHPLIWLSIFN